MPAFGGWPIASPVGEHRHDSDPHDDFSADVKRLRDDLHRIGHRLGVLAMMTEAEERRKKISQLERERRDVIITFWGTPDPLRAVDRIFLFLDADRLDATVRLARAAAERLTAIDAELAALRSKRKAGLMVEADNADQ